MSEMPRLTPPDMDAELDRHIFGIPEHCREGLRFVRGVVLRFPKRS